MAQIQAYAVVIFINDGSKESESASEVPANWLEENGTKCWWPTSKNVGPHILKRKTPDKHDPTKWQLHDVLCLGFYDSLSSARHKANGVSSGDESSLQAATQEVGCLSPIKEEKQVERKKNFKRKIGFSANKKQDDYLASDESDMEVATDIMQGPPKLEKTFQAPVQVHTNPIEEKKSGVKVISEVILPEKYNFKTSSADSIQRQENAKHPTTNFSNDTNGNLISFSDMEGPSMKDFLINLSDKICTKIGELTFAVRSTTDRLDEIERILNVNNLPTPTTKDDDFASVLPLRTIEEIKEFEMHLTIADLKQRLVSYLTQVGGNSVKGCLVRILKKVFGPEAAKQSSWCGQRGNFTVCDLGIIGVIKEAVKRSFACTDKYFEDEAKEWFRQGTQKYARIQKKNLAE